MGQRFCVDEVVGLLIVRRVQADGVGLLQQFLKAVHPPIARCEINAVREMRIIKDHLHFEACGTACRCKSDAAQTDNAERGAAQAAHQLRCGRPAPRGDGIRAQAVLIGHNAACQR